MHCSGMYIYNIYICIHGQSIWCLVWNANDAKNIRLKRSTLRVVFFPFVNSNVCVNVHSNVLVNVYSNVHSNVLINVYSNVLVNVYSNVLVNVYVHVLVNVLLGLGRSISPARRGH